MRQALGGPTIPKEEPDVLKNFRNIYFSPEDDIKAVLDALPQHATRTLDCEFFGFTDLVLVGQLIAAAGRGVVVRLLNDHIQASGASDHRALQILVDASVQHPNIAVRVCESPTGAIDHLKMVVVDGVVGALSEASSVSYGSYNASDTAQKENNLWVWTNSAEEVDYAQARFEAHWTSNPAKPEWQIVPTSVPATVTAPTATPSPVIVAVAADVPVEIVTSPEKETVPT